MTSEGVDLQALYESLDAATRKRYERLKKKNDEEAELEWIERKKKSRLIFTEIALAIFLACLMLSIVTFDFAYARIGLLVGIGVAFCGLILSTDW